MENQIHFRAIDEENFMDIIRMKRPETEKYVASNTFSLAQAWLYRENGDVFPCAIYSGGQVVGFCMLEEDMDEKCLYIWRIMFPVENENKGYGTAAINKIVDLARASEKYDYIELDCERENQAAWHVYEKAGFRATGEINNGSCVMRLDF